MLRRIIDTEPTAVAVALVRLLPLSNALINLGLAMSRVGTRPFLLGTLLGFLPQGVVATLIGSGLGEDAPLEGALQLAIAVLLLLPVVGWAWRHRARRRSL